MMLRSHHRFAVLSVLMGCGARTGLDVGTTSTTDAAPAPPPASLVAGQDYVCSLVGSDLWCWGNNNAGQLGDGTIVSRALPTHILGRVAGVAAGNEVTGVVRQTGEGGEAEWWGSIRLADASIVQRLVPTGVGNTSPTLRAFGHTEGYRLYFADAVGSFSCWGNNANNEFALGPYQEGVTPDVTLTPVRCPDYDTATQIAGGSVSVCALFATGVVKCVGANNVGQLGDGTGVSRDRLTPVLGVTTARGVAADCASLLDGRVRCWGYNKYGELGDGTTTTRFAPVEVVGIRDAVNVSSGIFHNCALRADATVVCWGRNDHGELGDGTTTERHTPVAVVGLTDVTELALGMGFSCARRRDGSVWCWGYNDFGQLGDGTYVSRPNPAPIKM